MTVTESTGRHLHVSPRRVEHPRAALASPIKPHRLSSTPAPKASSRTRRRVSCGCERRRSSPHHCCSPLHSPLTKSTNQAPNEAASGGVCKIALLLPENATPRYEAADKRYFEAEVVQKGAHVQDLLLQRRQPRHQAETAGRDRTDPGRAGPRARLGRWSCRRGSDDADALGDTPRLTCALQRQLCQPMWPRPCGAVWGAGRATGATHDHPVRRVGPVDRIDVEIGALTVLTTRSKVLASPRRWPGQWSRG
jgi:hypothetical protein